ncbi:MAG: tRNA (N(6)-L-threonylcarbamoyladenosine(37)-C(2))-methylthiotransferase MtaB [Candidatus Zixiibacteriota bacterium]
MSGATQKKVSFHTVGCRLNQYETEQMAAALYSYGFRRTTRHERADLCIINTCTVTRRADTANLRLVQKAARENPGAKIVLAGCYVDANAKCVGDIQHVDLTVVNREKSQLAEILSRELSDLFEVEPRCNIGEPLDLFARLNRALLKISDGCDQRCAFCILPRVRGPLKNRPPLEIVDEVRRLRQLGFEEVVLTGVNIGHYRHRTGADEPEARSLAQLCRLILDETDLPRLRLSSVEPQAIRDELLTLCAESGGRICRHFHIPLQSGSSRLLRLMHRPYDQQTYLNRVDEARATRPNTTIGADIIVGFPGETDRDFAETLALVDSGLLDYLHVFSYSDRPGTAASAMQDKVRPKIVSERRDLLVALSDRLWANAHVRQVGETLGVIAERGRLNRTARYGIADNYINVKLPTDFAGRREIQQVKITSATDGYAEGEVVSPHSTGIPIVPVPLEILSVHTS